MLSILVDELDQPIFNRFQPVGLQPVRQSLPLQVLHGSSLPPSPETIPEMRLYNGGIRCSIFTEQRLM